MAHSYAHQNDPRNTYVIRDLLINQLPQDYGWGTVREYVDWGSAYHLSNDGYMPEKCKERQFDKSGMSGFATGI